MPAPAPDLRPLTARSIVASTLLGMRPPRLSGRMLVASGELFGIAEGATRTALSRMVAAGELTTDADGVYQLAGRLLERQDRQDASRRSPTRRWKGTWEMAVVRAERRPARDRAELRRAMAALHLAEHREGVWIRPENLDPLRQPAARSVVDAQCDSFTAQPITDEPAALAARLWDLDAWQTTTTALRERMAAARPALDAGDLTALAPAFELSAVIIRHLVADPMLPSALLPPRWPGPALRAEYETYDRSFTRLWRRWYHAQDQSA